MFIINIFFMFLFFAINANYYSSHGQDQFIIEQFFKNKKNGIFIDIGATDGITQNNTYFFEKELNWTGICIEPIKTKFDILIKNRKCICINGCIFNKNGAVDFLWVDGPSYGLSGILETYDLRHLQRIDREINLFGGQKKLLKVKTYNLNDLCRQHNIKYINYLSIDTEGSEKEILTSIDFKILKIDVIVVENNYNDTSIRSFLKSQNFNLWSILGVDEIYVHNNLLQN